MAGLLQLSPSPPGTQGPAQDLKGQGPFFHIFHPRTGAGTWVQMYHLIKSQIRKGHGGPEDTRAENVRVCEEQLLEQAGNMTWYGPVLPPLGGIGGQVTQARVRCQAVLQGLSVPTTLQGLGKEAGLLGWAWLSRPPPAALGDAPGSAFALASHPHRAWGVTFLS